MRCILDKAASNGEAANEGGVVKEEEEEQGLFLVPCEISNHASGVSRFARPYENDQEKRMSARQRCECCTCLRSDIRDMAYCRSGFSADAAAGRMVPLSAYCTGTGVVV
jgi:hypothetical protein